MASIELLGGNDKVAKRTEELGRLGGELAARAIRNTLSPYFGPEPDELTMPQIVNIAEKERAKAIAKFAKERNEGKHNDKASIAVGVTALVRNPVLEQLETWRKDRQPSFLEPELTEVGEADGETLYRLRLPGGVFKVNDMDVTLFPEAQVRAQGIFTDLSGVAYHWTDRDKAINLSVYGGVVRVEGDSGE